MWLHPLQPNGIIQFYQLQIAYPGIEEPVLVNTTDNATMYVLANLTPGSQYCFSVRAFIVFFSPLSAQRCVYTADGEAILVIV